MVMQGEALYDLLQRGTLRDDVILDTSDRQNGAKLKEAALVGYPWQIIVGRYGNFDTILALFLAPF